MKFLASVLAFSVALGPSYQCTAFTNHLPVTNLYECQLQQTSSLSVFRFTQEAEEEASLISNEDFTTNTILNPVTDVCVLGLRLGTCALMIHHGLDKIQNVDGFSANVVAKFFGFLPGDPSFWTLSAAATQVVGSTLLALGVLSRPVAFAMMMTMIVAVVFHFLNTGLEGFPLAVVSQHSYNYELAAMYVIVLAYFSASGAGAFSIDEQVFGGELNLYNTAFNKIFNEEIEEPEVIADEKKSFKVPW